MARTKQPLILTACHPASCEQCAELKDQVREHVRNNFRDGAEVGEESPGRTHWAYAVYPDPHPGDAALPPYEGTYERADLDHREATYFEEPHHG